MFATVSDRARRKPSHASPRSSRPRTDPTPARASPPDPRRCPLLDMAWIRDHVAEVKKGAERKRLPCPIDELLAVDGERRKLVQLEEGARAEQNALGQQVRSLAGQAKEQAMERLKLLKAKVQEHAA